MKHRYSLSFRAWSALAYLALVCLLPQSSPGAIEAPSVFTGENLADSGIVHIERTSTDKALVLAFVSSRCPCSASHENELKRLAEAYSQKGFRFVGIHSNQNENPDEARVHFRASKLGFPIIRDTGAQIANQLGAIKTPHVYVIHPDGRILYQGGVDDSQIQQTASKHYLANALAQLTAGQDPEPSKTRALGCVISRRTE
ncbi:MAG: redoxin family protein [Bdellovibrionales bacterium]|nr:redoxin family protein [Bdellovibrionales bacterium]